MIGDDFNVPIMYQDLANSTMPPFANPFGGGVYYPNVNTNYLGGVRMRPQLDHDKLAIMNEKEKQDKKVFKKVLAALAVVVALGSIGPIRKGITKAGGIKNYCKQIWQSLFPTKKPPVQPSTNKTSGKIKNFFSNLWNKMKFKKKAPTPPAPQTPPTP